MTPDRWHQIEALLDAALAYEGADRRAFLDDACSEDDALCREVEALLDAEEGAPAFLDADAAAFAAPALPDLLAPAVAERRVGAYRLVQEIGQGGMGIVYLAERDDGAFEQQVALKLLRYPGHSEGLARRLRAERQILASLNHPHIARVFDGGVTEEGWPYLVMEYVEGVPLTDYCAAHDLSIRERLDLFMAVCRAVQHAHQHFVVHRDLKPSNILVTSEGRVKLLDFGIAKLLDVDDFALTVPLTQGHAHPMTPQYAAPEQVRGEAITTATDIYALGLLLYELLTGRRPYHIATHRATEIEQVICEHIPERPSKAITLMNGDVATAPAPDVLQAKRQLTGDLDAITLKALKKEPERRYASAADLLDDLRRHAEGLPVAARNDTARYRSAKFVQRHRTAVALSGLAVLALVVGLVVALWQANVATHERNAKELEAARAREMLDFAVGLFDVVDPDQAQGATITAQDLIATGRQRIEQLEAQPETQATMLDVMGRVSYKMGRYAEADSLYRQAIALKEEALGVGHPDMAASLFGLGEAQLMQDSLAAAEALFRQARALQHTESGIDDPETIRYLNALGFAYFTQGKHEEAEALFNELLARQDQPAWRNHPEIVEVRYSLARLLDYTGEREEAERLFREVWAYKQTTLGPEHSDAADVEYLLARNLANQDKLDAAATHYQHALTVYRRVYGTPSSPVANGIYALAQVQQKRGAYAEAAHDYREAAAMYRATLPSGNPFPAYAVVALGQVLLEQDKPAEAEAAFREGIAIYQAAGSPNATLIAAAQSWLGRSLAEQSRYAEAEPLLLGSYEVLKEVPNRKQWATDTLHRLQTLYAAWGQPEQAAAFAALLSEAEGEAEE